MTVYRGTRCKIFYNPRHAATRTANSVAHETSHVVLEHEPGPVLTAKGTRYWDQTQEDEADWLAGAILVPREGALRWLASGGSTTDGGAHFGVSAQLFGWRANHTGVGHAATQACRVSRTSGPHTIQSGRRRVNCGAVNRSRGKKTGGDVEEVRPSVASWPSLTPGCQARGASADHRMKSSP